MVMMVFPASWEKFGAQSTPATWSAWWWVSTMRRALASARWSFANCSAKYGSGLSGLKESCVALSNPESIITEQSG